MGKSEYDEPPFDRPVFSQPPFEDYQSSVDDAGPIGAGIEISQSRSATCCYFDDEGDWVYGDEVPLSTWTETIWWPVPTPTGRLMRAMVFEVEDLNREGQTITYTAWPYSKYDQGYGHLKRPDKYTKKKDIWREVEEQMDKKTGPIERLLDGFKHDVWRSSDGKGKKRLRGYSFEPLQEAAELYSYKHASEGQFTDTEQYIPEGDFERILRECLPPDIVAKLSPVKIYLYGLVEDYGAAKKWLLEHETIKELCAQVERGKLVSKKRWGREFLPDMVCSQAPLILLSSVHNALCGPRSLSEYRGDYVKQRGAATHHKQTVATHLYHLFTDALDMFHKRLLQAAPPRKEISFANTGGFEGNLRSATRVGSGEGVDDVKAETFSERIDRFKSCISEDYQARSDSDSLAAGLRSNDTDDVLNALAETVALHELGKTDREAIGVIQDMNVNLGGFDDATQQAIRQVVARLPQP